MSVIERNSRVTFHYRLGLSDDYIIEDNFDDEPLTVQLDCGEMAEGLELALIGLQVGDEQTVDIGPDLAFGFIDETLLRSMPRVEFDPALELEQGLIIEFATEQDETLPGTILEFDEVEVKIDLNHPLAGQTIRYSVKIIAVENSPVIIH
jgi:FKBP-type peptidyl-prolyl cis-trans isomerase SlpA